MPARPSLYSSPIQHVLVLEEEEEKDNLNTDTTSDKKPWNDGLTRSRTPPPPPDRDDIPYRWRIRDRMKTSHGVLVLCLNIGYDPSDVTKPNPCAKLQCWIDPTKDPPGKALHNIAHALKGQYERWQQKMRYKVAPDPTCTELKRVCSNLRDAAMGDRVLFHYNGHGVPKPTDQGEIWVFNHSYTHYIPFNLLDLHEVLGSPSLYVFDCNSAGTIFEHFKRVNAKFERQWEDACRKEGCTLPPPPDRNSIFLGACAAGELLPTSPSVPADLFTSCLTTPLKTALRWFSQRTIVTGVTPDMLDRIPGTLNDRQSPLGELNWIFTAITDTIAWNVLPREMFKKLYRQDTLLSILMRNFLLADRIMRTFGCHPVSYPALPETHTHRLWESFEISMEQLLSQLPLLLAEEGRLRRRAEEAGSHTHSSAPHVTFAMNGEVHHYRNAGYNARLDKLHNEIDLKARYRYRPCTFFEDQMRAFDVWLDMGPEQRSGPEQLPIMLQVFLSPRLRVKALPIISRYLQTGPEAVDQTLAVGIFPYVLRLLKFQSTQIRQDLVFIWSKILALDDSCRSDLVKEKGEEYFVRFLMPGRGGEEDPKPVYLAVAMFVLSVLAKDYAERCRKVGTLEACQYRLSHESSFVRRWACLCLTEVIKRSPQPSQSFVLAWTQLVETLRLRATRDPAPDVRAAAVSALSAIMNGILQNISLEEGPRPSINFRSESQARSDASGERNTRRGRDLRGIRLNKMNGAMSHDASLSSSRTPAADGFMMNTESDFRDAEVAPCLPDERDALLSIGKVITEVGRCESSVLVRREVAIAIAKAVGHRESRFVQAARVVDVIGSGEEEERITSTDLERCEAVYRSMWTALSELAYDPHPVIAALARRRYDVISEKIRISNGFPRSLTADDILAPGGRCSSRQNGSSTHVKKQTAGPRAELESRGSPSAGTQKRDMLSAWQNLDEASKQKFLRETPHVYDSQILDKREKNLGWNKDNELSLSSSPQNAGSRKIPTGKDAFAGHWRQRNALSGGSPMLRESGSYSDSVHVRSSSGSFSLEAEHSGSGIPGADRLGSSPLREGTTSSDNLGQPTPPIPSRSNLTGSLDLSHVPLREDRRILDQCAIAKGVGRLVKPLLQHLNLVELIRSPDREPEVDESERTKDPHDDRVQMAVSPRGRPKRSCSYQVLTAAEALSPRKESVTFEMTRHTSYAKSNARSNMRHSMQSRKVPDVFDRLYLSGVGDAALSLFEWSSAYISRVEATATSDCIYEEESIPRYAALWHKFTASGNKTPVEDSLRAFARLGESDSLRLEPIANEKEQRNDFKSARQLALYSMCAGGGSVTAMAFLPRDSGMGDDQLLATGDSTGSLGVYDIRTGKCQGVFRIPSPPGIPEVGVKSVLCLNNQTPRKIENGEAQPNSRSALILAGAYDGKAAVFKSDFQGRKYRIMSTFQASGQLRWSKATTKGKYSSMLGFRSTSLTRQASRSSRMSLGTAAEDSVDFAQAMRDSGNGLALAFDTDSSYLAAGGCDGEVVRVWDLRREQCIWEGAVVKQGTTPTALSMWNRANPYLFAVGSSGGDVNLVDIRERPRRANQTSGFRTLGSHSHPIISVGTYPRGHSGQGETVVAADIGGEMAFWEPRYNSGERYSSKPHEYEETTRIKACSSNIAAMAVHPSGRYLASGSTFGPAGSCVKIFGPKRIVVEMISHFERTTGGLRPGMSNRISPVSSLTFERETSLLAIGFIDSSVMIYGRPEHLSSF